MENIMPSGFKKPIGDLPTQDLSLFVKSKLIPFFFQLLGQGFLDNVPANCSIRDLIIDCLGIPNDYLEERIQTLFLNGSVVEPHFAVQSPIMIAHPGLIKTIIGLSSNYST